MKKMNNKGFMLAETLIVTAFVAGVLIFLYIQFSNLNKSYEQSFTYNSIEGLYALQDIKEYIESDSVFLEYLDANIETNKYIDIENCNNFSNKGFCLILLDVENVDSIFVTTNSVPKEQIIGYDDAFLSFINKINKEGEEPYRIVASFKNSMYATLRFGD